MILKVLSGPLLANFFNEDKRAVSRFLLKNVIDTLGKFLISVGVFIDYWC